MPNRRSAAAAAAAVMLATGATAEERVYPVFPIVSGGTTIVGETIRYPMGGAARVTAAIITVAPGAKLPVHKHGVPMFAYMLEGELTVDYGAHGTRTYRAGQGLLEAMDVPHFGANNGAQPARLLAVFMGAEGTKNVIPAE